MRALPRALLAFLPLVCSVMLVTAAEATAPETSTVPERAAPRARPAVLLGIPALRWDDIDRTGTPNLWRLAREGASGALSVRAIGTLACPIDGWLTVSAGARSSRPGGACAAMPPHPERSSEGAVVRQFPRYRASNLGSTFRSPVGLLGDTVRRARGCTTAVGPGAALALADTRGAVDGYAPSAAAADTRLLGRCAVTAIDVDDLIRTGHTRESRHRVDAVVGRVLAKLPPNTTVLVAGLTDGASEAGPHLRVAIAHGPGIRGGSYLVSASTRRQGVVITADLTATLLGAAAIPVPGEVIGTSWRSSGSRPGAASETTDLLRHDVAAQTYKSVLPRFFLALVITQVLFYVAAAGVLRGRWTRAGTGREPTSGQARRRRVLAATRLVALACAAVPVSTYLVNLLPWWRTGAPAATLLAGIAIFDALVVTFALAGPWRRALLGPGTAVAAATAVTIAADLLTGTRLQLYSLMGYSPLVGGRYYGLGNIAFSVFATSVLLTSVGAAQYLVRGRGRGAAVAVVLALGLTAMLLDGLPLWGADFGGVVALVPGLAVTALMVAERRVSPARLIGFCAMGGALVLGIAYLDHLRPTPTHLGRFFGELLAGEAGPTIERKFSAMIRTIGEPTLTPIVVAALAFLFVVLRRPERLRAGVLDLAYARAPLLRAGLMGALVTAVVGFGVNDSGIAVLALALVVAVPLTLVAGIRALQLTAIPDPRADPADLNTGPIPAPDTSLGSV